MGWAGEPDVVTALRNALEGSEAVSSVVLGGSRARGEATELSDWDIEVDGDPEAMMAEIPALVAALGPLAAFWEPLSETAGYMVVMEGPTKIDVFPLGGRRAIQPPWRLDAASLPQIDAHFWDWILWLGSKALRGESRLVADELDKMYRFLLAPVGAAGPPASLDEAVASYLPARHHAVDSLHVDVRPELGRQVSDALRRHALLVS